MKDKVIEEIRENLKHARNAMKEYKYFFRGNEVTIMVSGRTLILRNLPSEGENRAFPMRSTGLIDYADLVILMNDKLETYVLKNRWGCNGLVADKNTHSLDRLRPIIPELYY